MPGKGARRQIGLLQQAGLVAGLAGGPDHVLAEVGAQLVLQVEQGVQGIAGQAGEQQHRGQG